VTISIESIVLNQSTLGPSSPSPVTSGVINLLPYHDFSWANSLTFILTVGGVSGSPTAGTLAVKFQLGNPHRGDGSGGTATYPYSHPHLMDLETAQKTTLIIDGADWPSPVASFSLAAPVTFKRTITNFGAMCNLQLDVSSLTGGTNPMFTGISLMLIQKGD
jgi:hypothetical protein